MDTKEALKGMHSILFNVNVAVQVLDRLIWDLLKNVLFN
jgi:hypothetical protein